MENSPKRQHVSQDLKDEYDELASQRDKEDEERRDRYSSQGNIRRQQEKFQPCVLANAEGSMTAGQEEVRRVRPSS